MDPSHVALSQSQDMGDNHRDTTARQVDAVVDILDNAGATLEICNDVEPVPAEHVFCMCNFDDCMTQLAQCACECHF